jgi:class 3 adenylate cyclase
MAALSTSERAKLPDSAFAYVDSAGRRRLPIHDEAHVRNALARFGRIEFEDERARDRARTRLLKAAKKYGIVPIGFIDAQLRPRLPTGTVTLLFADLEASSRLLGELGERYSAVMSTVRRILRHQVRRLGGHEVDARADELLAVFTDPVAALDAAVATQREMEATSWPDGRSVRVRIGLHTGRPTLTGSGYVGLAVNAGARICEAGHGGQILVSRTTRAALGERAEDRLRPLGSHRLRGIGDEELFQVVEAGLPDSFPPLRTGL